MTVDRHDAARGAVLGLAVGDAAGLPAWFHRAARSGWSRSMLWRLSADLDAQQVSRPLLPFSPAATGPQPLCGTDDTETMAVAALALLDGAAHDVPELFAAWRRYYADDPGVWSGIAERSAIRNARSGLVPPVTGADNPVHWDDSAVATGVAVGVRYAGDPDGAGRVAAGYAGITHAEDGVWAAEAMARAIAALIGGETLEDAVAVGVSQVPEDSWLGRNLRRAQRIRESAESAFAAVPEMTRVLSPDRYSHAGVAPETLPVALTIARLSDGDPAQGVQSAALMARQSDSVPAMVGALCGAARGAGALPEAWTAEIDTVRGVLVPAVAGLSLSDLADRLVRQGSPLIGG
ncbi:ADP-ribosylglycohydrolase family protein [Nocardiopsis sediminis]|uniref:ADP-ribosylglycohydrolase family protein n=1 Tax=Nocardiopsis sediminis TaxID=1778267 RepID=A0ABV8FKQ5_9ACTN